MKKGNFTSLVLLSGALAFPAFAEKVKFEDLPSGLQEKIRSQVGGSAKIQDIDRNTRDGKTIYEVGYKKDGQHNEARFEYDQPQEVTSSTSSSTAGSQSAHHDHRQFQHCDFNSIHPRASPEPFRSSLGSGKHQFQRVGEHAHDAV